MLTKSNLSLLCGWCHCCFRSRYRSDWIRLLHHRRHLLTKMESCLTTRVTALVSFEDQFKVMIELRKRMMRYCLPELQQAVSNSFPSTIDSSCISLMFTSWRNLRLTRRSIHLSSTWYRTRILVRTMKAWSTWTAGKKRKIANVARVLRGEARLPPPPTTAKEKDPIGSMVKSDKLQQIMTEARKVNVTSSDIFDHSTAFSLDAASTPSSLSTLSRAFIDFSDGPISRRLHRADECERDARQIERSLRMERTWRQWRDTFIHHRLEQRARIYCHQHMVVRLIGLWKEYLLRRRIGHMKTALAEEAHACILVRRGFYKWIEAAEERQKRQRQSVTESDINHREQQQPFSDQLPPSYLASPSPLSIKPNRLDGLYDETQSAQSQASPASIVQPPSTASMPHSSGGSSFPSSFSARSRFHDLMTDIEMELQTSIPTSKHESQIDFSGVRRQPQHMYGHNRQQHTLPPEPTYSSLEEVLQSFASPRMAQQLNDLTSSNDAVNHISQSTPFLSDNSIVGAFEDSSTQLIAPSPQAESISFTTVPALTALSSENNTSSQYVQHTAKDGAYSDEDDALMSAPNVPPSPSPTLTPTPASALADLLTLVQAGVFTPEREPTTTRQASIEQQYQPSYSSNPSLSSHHVRTLTELADLTSSTLLISPNESMRSALHSTTSFDPQSVGPSSHPHDRIHMHASDSFRFTSTIDRSILLQSIGDDAYVCFLIRRSFYGWMDLLRRRYPHRFRS